MSALDRRVDFLTARVARLERAVGLKADGTATPPAPTRPPEGSAWVSCDRPQCQRSSFRQIPACMKCAGYDPRTGEGMDPAGLQALQENRGG
jgi:hypothetical protein